MTTKLAPITITGHQRKWLEEEKKRTGNTFAVLIRNLIQDKINQYTGLYDKNGIKIYEGDPIEYVTKEQ